jgi:hypothetical protein
MSDVALLFVGFLTGTYVGLVLKKNNITVLPRKIDLGIYGAKGDIDKEY